MKNRNYFTLFFSLTLMCAFVICSAIVLFFQINSYHDQQQRNELKEADRLADSYLTTLFHQRTDIVSMEIRMLENTVCLVITNEQNATITYVYAYDGYLRELYVDENSIVTLASGDKITPMDYMDIKEDKNLYTFQMKFQDDTKELYLYQY